MAKIPFSFGGGGGDSSDDCTAEAEDILESKTAIYNGSDDDALAGTMKDYSGTSTQATGTMNDSNSRLEFAPAETGKYDTASKLYLPYSTARSLIGYTDAAKVLTGTTICGLAGTMADKSGTSTAATSSTSGSNVRLQIPTNAYYNTSAYLTNSYSNMASTIGLTAAKIKYGETILGITGTWNGYVATTSDVYYGGAFGICGSGTAITGASSWTVTFDTSCIVLVTASGSTSQSGVYFANSINCGAYSSITMTYQVISASNSSSSSYMTLALYTSRPSSSLTSNILISEQKTFAEMSAGNTYTITINLSSVSQTAYVGFYLRSSSASYTVNVTRIQVS